LCPQWPRCRVVESTIDSTHHRDAALGVDVIRVVMADLWTVTRARGCVGAAVEMCRDCHLGGSLGGRSRGSSARQLQRTRPCSYARPGGAPG
jgi:hypothetical protein